MQNKLAALHLGKSSRREHEHEPPPRIPLAPSLLGRLHLSLALLERAPMMGAAAHLAMARQLLPWVLQTVAVDCYDQVCC